MTRRPITVTVDIPEEEMEYAESDTKVIARGALQAFDLLVEQEGSLDTWTLRCEAVELNEWTGVRLTLDGVES